MKVVKFIQLIVISLLCFILTASGSDDKSVSSVNAEYRNLAKTGHLKEAITCLSGYLSSNKQLTAKERLGINNNLGILNKNLGQYDIALHYYDEAESLYLNNNFTENSFLVSIYGNKANIYSAKGDFDKALEYIDKAIRTIPETNGTVLFKQQSTSGLYLNLGIVNYQLNNFQNALSAFQKSIALKDKYNLPGKDNVYLNLAKTYARIGNNNLAEKYYNTSIRKSVLEYTVFSRNLPHIYLEYGNFLLTIEETSRALAPIQKALDISLKNFGEKSQITSNCYQLMGDYYRIVKNNPEALNYYQKTLISGTKDFDDQRFESNPSMSEITLNLWQLRVLQRKAEVLALLAEDDMDKNGKIRDFTVSLNTYSLTVEMTNKIRVDYQDEETRLIFNEKQKNVFTGAIETALKLYDLTGEKRFLQFAYQTTQQSKANELKYEIARNISFTNKEIPDSLRNKEREIQREIAAYNALIRSESALASPDTSKIFYWKDQQFNLNRSLEKAIETIELNYPRFTDKLKRANIIPIEKIQDNLKPDDSLIEYVFSEADFKGDRRLYEFVITPNDYICHTELINSAISSELSGLKEQFVNQFAEINSVDKYNLMNKRLFAAYSVLIRPIEKYFVGKQLIIIPDDELSYLPFDAFLTSWKQKKGINYAELAYLIRDYSISYGYSTNTLWNTASKVMNRPRVIGFAPDYGLISSVGEKSYKPLKKNHSEVDGILINFSGTVLKDEKATVANFKENLNRGAILHLAMHAELDTSKVGSSSLIFSEDHKNPGNHRLYNYEIGQMSINSPMVVLSACSTGTGKFYSGEGLMSLARNFVLAGVPSVIETLWPVEDIAGSKIMGNFYKYLSSGIPKNNALRLAKLDYINNTSPSFVNPGYWAAYTLMGDVTPIKKIWWKEPWSIITLLFSTISILAAIIVYRLRFLRIN